MGNALSLYELNSLVTEAVSLGLSDEYWVEAEISSIIDSRGNCYMELIEKNQLSNTIIAHAKAKCWRHSWMRLRSVFERATGQQMHSGMKVMLLVHADFHANYGFSWIVDDINSEYTLGDMARRRREIIDRLKEEGVFDMQRELTIPIFARSIAVVSSKTAAGYGDFMHHITDNAYGFAFEVTLFNATMQGEDTERSIVAALNEIYERANDFDVVVIIRGGGAVADLSWFDNLVLAENVANFPLPIITGIGHDRDESVLDMVANMSVKTPTAAADLLIENLATTQKKIVDLSVALAQHIYDRIEKERMRLDKIAAMMPIVFSLIYTKETAAISQLCSRLTMAVEMRLSNERHRIELLHQRVDVVNPKRILRMGYSITLHNGKAVCSAASIGDGETIETILEKGKLISIVQKTKNETTSGKK